MRIKFLKDFRGFKKGSEAEAPAQMLPENAQRLIDDGYAELVVENKRVKAPTGKRATRKAAAAS